MHVRQGDGVFLSMSWCPRMLRCCSQTSRASFTSWGYRGEHGSAVDSMG